jgi:hypothetical protein
LDHDVRATGRKYLTEPDALSRLAVLAEDLDARLEVVSLNSVTTLRLTDP